MCQATPSCYEPLDEPRRAVIWNMRRYLLHQSDLSDEAVAGIARMYCEQEGVEIKSFLGAIRNSLDIIVSELTGDNVKSESTRDMLKRHYEFCETVLGACSSISN